MREPKCPPTSWCDCAIRCSTIRAAPLCFSTCSRRQGETVIELPDQVRIASTPELEATVERLFGPRVSFQSLNS